MRVANKFFSHPSRSSLGLWLLIVILAVVAGYQAFRWSERAGYEQLDATSSHQLDLYIAGLESELGKYQYLPSVMEMDEDLASLLQGHADAVLAEKVNGRLASLSVRAGAIAVYALDTEGIVRASSNWYRPGSFIGQDFSDLPYFIEAMNEGESRFFSPNATLDSPEYHFAQPIRHAGKIVGVAVAKISLGPIESTWTASVSHSQKEKFVVIDGNDIIIIASVPEWRYEKTSLLSEMLGARLAKSGDYEPVVIEPLGMTIERVLNHGNQLFRMPATQSMRRALHYMSQERYMVRPGWRLITFSEASQVKRDAEYAALGAVVMVGFFGLLGQYLLQRRRANANLRAARDALQRAHDELERKVAERTAELHSTNQDLVREISERKRTEADLRETQDELIQASKLAVLGQMSAGITHEINQPLTALRSLTHNTRLLLARGQTERISHNLQSISSIAERMGRITQQLKSFARKQPLEVGPLMLARAVDNVLLLLGNRIASEQIAVEVELAPDLCVMADGNRLEQVLINLLANAFDAMAEAPRKSVMLQAESNGDRVTIRIEDSGPGIPEESMARLFEPFFSTKPSGQGLGLGLAISAGIVRDLGGTLQARNAACGAVFEFDLKHAEDENNV